MQDLERRPTSAMSEGELLRAGLGRGLGVHRIEPRSETCCCGDVIRVEDGADEWLIARAVNIHNQSTRHARWATLEGLR